MKGAEEKAGPQSGRLERDAEEKKKKLEAKGEKDQVIVPEPPASANSADESLSSDSDTSSSAEEKDDENEEDTDDDDYDNVIIDDLEGKVNPEAYTQKQLKDLCKNAGLSVGGNKSDLAERLNCYNDGIQASKITVGEEKVRKKGEEGGKYRGQTV